MCYASGVLFYDLENNCVDKSSNISLVYFVMSDRGWPGRTSAGGAPAPAIVMVILQFLLVEISSNSNWIYLQTFTFEARAPPRSPVLLVPQTTDRSINGIDGFKLEI